MRSVCADLSEYPDSGFSHRFPREVEFVISALEAGPRPLVERQAHRRMRHRVKAMLRLYSDDAQSRPKILFTRQVSVAAVGFVSSDPFPLSHGGTLSIAGPDGRHMEIECTVLRCRQAAPGWYEGALRFNRPQPDFAPPEEPVRE